MTAASPSQLSSLPIFFPNSSVTYRPNGSPIGVDATGRLLFHRPARKPPPRKSRKRT